MSNLDNMAEVIKHLIFDCSNRNLVQLGFNEAVRGNARMCKPRVGWIKAVETIVEFVNMEWCWADGDTQMSRARKGASLSARLLRKSALAKDEK